LLYKLSRLAIMYNNVLYMYILLKSIHIKCFSKKFGGTAVPHATTLEPPLARPESP